ncbi:hypothetical protein CCUS01_14345 [Colletotrichum cuscutae]|uniref:DUF4470 domain-containing protein n=1 Tax=Colletotrichum cuscutae TaxID=1209917 RepID=A0AAI9Y947_9PEZI|nr:hypothetical protein CCUS01_14345 [Colletotrichum cuscutae]
MATFQLICANQAPDNTKCNNTGRFACKNCLLVTVGATFPMKISSLSANLDFLQYCGPECQKSHWTVHKLDCKSHLGRESWQPGWVLENRAPAFIGNGPPQVTYGAGKYLWGNVPAFDVLRLGANEGVSYDEQLRLLFAASGDLRNVVKTIAKLPDSYTQSIEVTMNDRDLNIVARNVIMLLISLVVDDVDIAADCIIHVWSAWDDLLSFTDTPKGLTSSRVYDIRKAVTLAEGRKDYRDRHLLLQYPSYRIALTRFREDGLLLPFGAARDAFRHPNPWPMYDNADPLNGWSSKDVQETQTGPATADIYGKLFTSLRTVLRAFLRRLLSSQTSFKLFYMDASALPKFLENSTFSRIEVSNISDAGYLGIYRTLDLMIPLLQSPLVNPHATLITLFMNAVDENATEIERLTDMKADGLVMKRIYNVVELFAVLVCGIARLVGAAMKGSYTVIEKWPFKLKLRPGQTGAQEEFDRLLGGGVSSKERYVEWKRV